MSEGAAQLTVLADETGEIVAMMHSGDRPSHLREGVEVSIRLQDGQVAATVDPPEELAGRRFDGDYLDALRERFTVRDGRLAQRGAPAAGH